MAQEQLPLPQPGPVEVDPNQEMLITDEMLGIQNPEPMPAAGEFPGNSDIMNDVDTDKMRAIAKAESVDDLPEDVRAEYGRDLSTIHNNLLHVKTTFGNLKSQAAAEVARSEALRAERRADAQHGAAVARDTREVKLNDKQNAESGRVYSETYDEAIAAGQKEVEDAVRLAEAQKQDKLAIVHIRREAESRVRREAQDKAAAAVRTRMGHINERNENGALVRGGIGNLEGIREEEKREAERQEFRDHFGVGGNHSTAEQREEPDFAKLERPDGVSYRDWLNMSIPQRQEAVASNHGRSDSAEADDLDVPEFMRTNNDASSSEAAPDVSRITGMSDSDIRNADPSMMEGMTDAERNEYFRRLHEAMGEDRIWGSALRERNPHGAASATGTPAEVKDQLDHSTDWAQQEEGDYTPNIPAPAPRRRFSILRNRPERVETGGPSVPELPAVNRGDHTEIDTSGDPVGDYWSGIPHRGPEGQGARSWHERESWMRALGKSETYKAMGRGLKRVITLGRSSGRTALDGEVERPEGVPAAPARPVRPVRQRRERVARPAAARSGEAQPPRSVDELLGDADDDQF